MDILELCKPYRSICISGMDKNTGKTTVLNKIISQAAGKISLGLTSLGRDGEERDRVTGTGKPRIYVRQGTYVATAKGCLLTSDMTREIVAATGIQTPLGEVVIAKALSDGYAELAGPSISVQMGAICRQLSDLGCQLTLVDGALHRKAAAAPTVTAAAILATGAALSGSLEQVISLTQHAVRLLSLSAETDSRVVGLCQELPEHVRACLISGDYQVRFLQAATALGAAREIVSGLTGATRYIVVKGVVSDQLATAIMAGATDCRRLTILAENSTKIFVSPEIFRRWEKRGGTMTVINPINLICVTANPLSPHGYAFERQTFLARLRAVIPIPVLDVREEEGDDVSCC